METPSYGAQIDAFVMASRALNGKVIHEREPWNTVASADAIRHFAYGTGDDNPLWLDAAYAATAPYGRRLAPPTFLASVCYPGLHGAPMDVPLTSVIGALEYSWKSPVMEGDRLYALAKQTDVFDTEDEARRRMVFILSEVMYYREPEEAVGQARCTLVRPLQQGTELRLDRQVYRYSDTELDEITRHLTSYVRTGKRPMLRGELTVGRSLPVRVTPPLTIGDLVGWQAAIGPSYRAGPLGYKDGLRAPHQLITNPVTGWPVKYSQGHEDMHLAAQRGMPAPFDNSVMRFAYVASILTDWMGDHGFLQRLLLRTQAPVLYGDTTWYHGTIRRTREEQEGFVVSIEIVGTNQLGETTTTGEADVMLSSFEESSPKPTVVASRAPTFLAGRTVSYPNLCVHTLFERQAMATPEACAVVFAAQCLTYRQLNERAMQSAAALRRAGVGRGAVVGVCAERSVAYVATLLGILKAGGAFLPVNPNDPQRRLDALLTDAKPTFVLVSHALRSLIPERHPILEIETLRVDTEDGGTPAEVHPEDRAYVLYTSGSTGTPKGVVVSHRSLSRYLQSIRAPLDIRPSDVYLHSASFVFSASIRQLLLPLTTGASLVVADFEQRHHPQQLFKLMRAQGVTVWDTVPSFWRYCLNTLEVLTDPSLLPETLRLLFTTGEPLPWALPQTWREVWKHPAEVFNLYSQTETVGTISAFRIPKNPRSYTGFVPLGGPVENTDLYVLDEALRPVPRGEVGELCVGGDRLAEGYLNRASLTAQKFVPNVFSDLPTGRLYRTGDLVRLTADDTLEWVGRKDRQVQIRGHRVEPAEVEAALTAHPSIQEAVVKAHADAGGEQVLAAYIVPSPSAPPTVSSLRHFLEARLPLVMVPATFTMLDTLPRTASGKLDPEALLSPEAPSLVSYVAPTTPMEELLAEIWAEVLLLRRVGRTDNFFDLGGQSLHAVSIMMRVRERLNVHLSLRLLFDAPTPAEMAVAVEKVLQEKDEGGPLPPEIVRR